MSSIGLTTSTTQTLIGRFSSISSSSSSDSLRKAIQGQSDSTSISATLRTGARTYATAIQGLNSLVAFTNLSETSLEKLGDMTDKMINLADRAAKSSTGDTTRRSLEIEFRKLAHEFETTIENAEVGDQNYLTRDGLVELFGRMGLDEETSSSVAAHFEKFALVKRDDSLASEYNRGPRPVPISVEVPGKEFEELFDPARTLANRGNAVKLAVDLRELRSQITENLLTMDKAQEFLQENIDLVRATGLAMLELSDQVGSETDASKVARDLNQLIRAKAPGVLSQAENLDPITVATLALASGAASLTGER